VSAPPGLKLELWFLGFVFRQAGTDLEKKGDGKTTNPVVAKF
jgi:hypothetical protein